MLSWLQEHEKDVEKLLAMFLERIDVSPLDPYCDYFMNFLYQQETQFSSLQEERQEYEYPIEIWDWAPEAAGSRDRRVRRYQLAHEIAEYIVGTARNLEHPLCSGLFATEELEEMTHWIWQDQGFYDLHEVEEDEDFDD